MSEHIGDGFGAEYSASLGNNYLTSHNVRARFLLYEFGLPYLDIEDKALAALNLNGLEDIVDLGAADGSFLRKIRVAHDHQGDLFGIEPNTTQFSKEPIWQSIEPELIVRSMKRFYGDQTLTTSKNARRYIDSGLPRVGSDRLELRKGSADNIPLATNRADVLFAMFMMYHVPPSQQPTAFEEIKRVLKPEGIFVMTTSGSGNKAQHRLFEEQIAERLNVKAPQPMNTGFTTDKAELVLPNHFKHVRVYKHPAEMIINDALSVRAYLSSQLSLRDQYSPVPDEATFTQHMRAVIMPVLNNAIQEDGALKDTIERSIFICSDREIRLGADGFTKIG